MTIQRLLTVPDQSSFFLFGPRGTGKSTWLKTEFKADLTIDLLRSSQYLELSAQPSLIEQKAAALKGDNKIVIDEIQKVPALLDEVHSLIFEHDARLQFALTGSSARKLKRSHANMLAGRAIKREMFPFVSAELKSRFHVTDAMTWGTLPAVILSANDQQKKDFLYTYAETYLREEIELDAAIRNLPAYHRFLRHAAIMNGKVLNLSSISREASVPRATLDGYFEILQDTLLGRFVEPIHLKAKVKEVSTPKFYFFDCGVVRALRGDLYERVDPQEAGYLLETLLFNEIRAYSSYFSKHLEIFYWGTPSDTEVDFIVCKGRKKWAIEVKASRQWKREFNKGLLSASASNKLERLIGVYQGKDPLVSNSVEVFPVDMFCEQLFSHMLF